MTSEQTTQHSFDEGCFHCASDEEILRGIGLMDEGKPWNGRTIHQQVPPEFCPHFGSMIEAATDPDDRHAT